MAAAVKTSTKQCMAKAFCGNQNSKSKGFHQCHHKALPAMDFCARHKDKQKHGLWNEKASLPEMPSNIPMAREPGAGQAPPAPLAPAAVPPAVVPEAAPLLALLPIPWAEYVEVGWHSSARPKAKAKPEEPPSKKQKNDIAALAKVYQPGKQEADAAPEPDGPPAKKQKVMSQEDIDALQSLASATSKQENAAIAYAEFCQTASAEVQDLLGIGSPTETKHGNMFLSEMGVMAWLKALSKNSPVSTVAGKFSALKSGIRALSLPAESIPHWMQHKQPAPPMIARFLCGTKKAEVPEEKPAVPQGYITREQVLGYILDLVAMDMSGEALGQATIAKLYMLWTEAGRSHRISSLQGIKWGMVGKTGQAAGHREAAGEDQHFVCIPATKQLGNLPALEAAKAKCLIKFYLGDEVSKYLHNAWLAIAPQDVQDDGQKYFFPHHGPHGFDFTKPVSNQTFNNAILECAQHLGLVLNPEHAATFNANSLRRGIAVEVKHALEETLGKLNVQHGRGPASNVDQQVYCPRHVLVEPGLLHTDLVAVKATWDHKFAGQQAAKKDSLLCQICGYPNCKCTKCALLAAGTASSKTHDKCWLSTRGPGKKSKKWIGEAPDQLQARVDAWLAHGIQDVPVFKEGKFTWMV